MAISKPTFVSQDGFLISILPPSDRKPSRNHVKKLENGVKVEFPDYATIIVQPWED